ncbi:MAG: DUF7661 family protein [Pseudomonadota bacterium]
MRFDVYGRYRIDVERRDGAWVVFRVGSGTRVPMPDIVIPPGVPPDELGRYLSDLLHESATPGRELRRVE